MTKNGSVQRLDGLQSRLLMMRAQQMTWRKIAEKFPGVPAGTLCAISKGREPKKAAIRAALGLPPIVSVEACPKCGVVHVRKTCPPKSPPSRPRRRSRRALAVELLNRLWG